MPAQAGDHGHHVRLAVPQAAVELFETALARLGAAVASGPPDVEGRVPLDAYFAAEPDSARLTGHLAAAAAAAGVPVPAFESRRLPAVDWVEESYRGLPAIRAGRFCVYGGHVERRPPPGAIALRIEAGRAFGTGHHETTRGCLLALEALAKNGMNVRRALDLGCGSGVLALAIARLWRARVVAADDDPSAVAVCRRNARVNGCALRVRPALGDGYRSPAVRGAAPYDLVAANILAGPLAAMAGELARHLAPGGRAVLSGLLASQQRAVVARHRAQGLMLERRLLLGDWATLVLRRPGKEKRRAALGPPQFGGRAERGLRRCRAPRQRCGWPRGGGAGARRARPAPGQGRP